MPPPPRRAQRAAPCLGAALALLPGAASALDHPARVADYTLAATLDPTRHTVHGEGTITWRNPASAPVGDLWLHRYLNGFAGPHTLFMRTAGDHESHAWGGITVRSLALSTGEDLLAREDPSQYVAGDRSELHVTLPRPVAPGEAITLRVAWDATLPEVIARTGYHEHFHMVAQWFPKLAAMGRDGRWAHFAFHAYSEFYADFGRYDVTVTAPAGYTVGATGARQGEVERTPAGDRQRWVQDDVHDFAFVAWDRFRERRAPVGAVHLRVLHPPGEEGAAQRVVDALQSAMPRFAERYGPYPYATLTVVIPPRGAEEAGGMEYPTLITTVGGWWMPRRLRGVEYVTLHEFGHQYFYGLVASNEHDAPFLDEGFCEYATARAMEDLYGRDGPLLDIPWLAPRFDTFAYESAASAAIAHPLAVALGAAEFPSWGAYGSHVYARTATALRAAERVYGRDRFAAAMRAYVDRWRFDHPTADDMLATMRASLGDDAVTSLLAPALTRPARLDASVSWAGSQRDGRGVWRGGAWVHREGTLSLPVDVELRARDGRSTRARLDGPATSVWVPYEGPRALASVRVDPEARLALDEDRWNNARVAQGQGHGPTLPLVARVAWWVSLLLRGVGL